MSEDDPEVVVLASKILARLIVIHGSNYNKKFSEKTGGYIIMRHRLKRWWNVPALWPICFAILFGLDVGRMNLDRPFDKFVLLDLFTSEGEIKVMFPEILPAITEMLQSGLKRATLAKEHPAVDSQDGCSLQMPQDQSQRYSMSSSVPLGKAFLLSLFIRCTRSLCSLYRRISIYADDDLVYCYRILIRCPRQVAEFSGFCRDVRLRPKVTFCSVPGSCWLRHCKCRSGVELPRWRAKLH